MQFLKTLCYKVEVGSIPNVELELNNCEIKSRIFPQLCQPGTPYVTRFKGILFLQFYFHLSPLPGVHKSSFKD